jgi:hypothetical protein
MSEHVWSVMMKGCQKGTKRAESSWNIWRVVLSSVLTLFVSGCDLVVDMLVSNCVRITYDVHNNACWIAVGEGGASLQVMCALSCRKHCQLQKQGQEFAARFLFFTLYLNCMHTLLHTFPLSLNSVLVYADSLGVQLRWKAIIMCEE